MSDTANPTFRDFASEIFAGDLGGASATLVTLLALPSERARAATEHFHSQTADPSFLPKAMALRTVIAGPDDAAVVTLLGECFGLVGEEARAATTALRVRYPVA